MKHWSAELDHVNDVGYHLERMRGRVENELKNNSFLQRGHNLLTNYTIGCGISPHVSTSDGNRGALNLKAVLKDFLLTQGCDENGIQNFLEMQWTFFNCVVGRGQSLLALNWHPYRRGITTDPLPIRMRGMEPEHIDTSFQGHSKHGEVIDGHVYGTNNRLKGYMIFRDHPMNYRRQDFKSVFVPAQNLLTTYEVRRWDQRFGTPWAHAAALPLKEFRDLGIAVSDAQKIAACMGIVIENGNWSVSLDKARKAFSKIIPNRTWFVPAGTKVTAIHPPQSAQQLSHLQKAKLLEAAAALDVPVELLLGDMSETNYSSMRAKMNDFQVPIKRYQQNLMIGRVLSNVSRWIYQAMDAIGLYRGDAQIVWCPPRFPDLDAEKENKALLHKMRIGRITFQDMCREDGRDPVDVIEAYKQAYELMDNAGVVFDFDVRNINLQGTTHQTKEDETEDEDGGGKDV